MELFDRRKSTFTDQDAMEGALSTFFDFIQQNDFGRDSIREASKKLLDAFKPSTVRDQLRHIGWHTFRHTFRSLLDETGAPLKVQQELMRHADIRTTMNIYGKAMEKSKREAHGKVSRIVGCQTPTTCCAWQRSHDLLQRPLHSCRVLHAERGKPTE